jgi:hypothetical protein
LGQPAGALDTRPDRPVVLARCDAARHPVERIMAEHGRLDSAHCGSSCAGRAVSANPRADHCEVA